MTTRRVLIGVGVALLVLFLLAIFAGAILWGRSGYFMGAGMMRGFGYGEHMYGGWGWIVMIVFWVLVVGGLVLLVSWLVRRGSTPSGRDEMAGPRSESPLDIAKRRYASGEIDGDEFERIKQSLLS